MNLLVLTLQPGGQAIAQNLGFGIGSVIVDNGTADYVNLPDAGRQVPPWTFGAVLPMPQGLTTARANLVATTPALAGPAVPVVQAVLTWTDAVLSPDPGVQMAGAAIEVSASPSLPVQFGGDQVTPIVIGATSVTGSGGVLVILPAGGTFLKVMELGAFSFHQDGANATGRWQLQDTLGNQIHDMFCGSTRGLLDRGNFCGRQVTANVGLQLVNNGTSASFVGGFLNYRLVHP